LAYSVPKCDCGENLIYLEESEAIIDKRHKITRNGKLSKRYSKDAWITSSSVCLLCIKCGYDYEIAFDEKGRIIRGSKNRKWMDNR
jgi:hypothetical protein